VEIEAFESRSFVESRYSRGGTFEVALSGTLAVETLNFAPGMYEGKPSRTSVGASLRELYFAWLGTHTELRLGQQRLSWGVLDFAKVNDIVNARDLRDPFPVDDSLLSLPTPLFRLDRYWDALSLEGVLGWFVPDRFDLYGRRWAAIQPGAPLHVKALAHLLASHVDSSRQEPLGDLLQTTGVPSTPRSAFTAGAKATLQTGNSDFDVYYHYGYDGTPNLRLTPEFEQAAAATDWSSAGLASLSPLLSLLDAGRRPYEARYVRRHHVGADAVTIAGPFALRFEAAYDSARVFSRVDLSGFVAPVVLGALGVEYQTGSAERQLSLEARGMHLRRAAPELIGYARDTVDMMANLRWPLLAGFGIGLRALLGVRPATWVVKAELEFIEDDLKITLGAMWLDGEARSVGDYYAQTATLYTAAKYGF
jgi:hypothetical protein